LDLVLTVKAVDNTDPRPRPRPSSLLSDLLLLTTSTPDLLHLDHGRSLVSLSSLLALFNFRSIWTGRLKGEAAINATKAA
jgi:hypothetical protein